MERAVEDARKHTCLNCGAELQGLYCHQCGQKDQHKRMPLVHLLHDVFHDLWHFDAKVLGTLWLLVRRPGFLTAEYLNGKRVRHVPPFRLYVVLSFVTFFLLALSHGTSKLNVEITKTTAPAITFQSTPEEIARAMNAPQDNPETAEGTPGQSRGWAKELARRGSLAAKDPSALKKAFLSGVSKVMFLLMPLFASLLFLLHARHRNTYFVDHMVLSLHFHTIIFLVILGYFGLSYVPDSCFNVLPGFALFFWPLLWLTFALQRLHTRGWLRSAAKACLLLSIYGLISSAALLGVFYISLPK